jgi:Uma2 family endonuclease
MLAFRCNEDDFERLVLSKRESDILVQDSVGKRRSIATQVISSAQKLVPIFVVDCDQGRISPGNTAGEIQGKRRDYLESGAIQVWIDLDHRSVELVQPDRSLRFFNQDETFVIDSLPGFALELKTLFAF